MKVPKIWRRTNEFYCLIGKKCNDCGELYFPNRLICKKCGSLNMIDYEFIGKGEILTYTIIRTNFDSELERFFRKNPYIIAIIKLEEGPKLTAEIVDCDINDLKIGKKVEFVFRKILEYGKKGVIQYGYKFRLVE